jgi:lipopolysaccharide export system permease protein
MKTLYKYIFNEIWPTFLTSLLVFIFIVLAARMVTISEWVINHGVSPLLVIQMILFLLPNIILFALPAASLMAVFIAFLRLSSDNEILAMKVSGISLYKMMPPVLLASLIAGLIAVFIGVYGAPWGNRTFKDLIVKIAQSNAALGIKERVFSEPFTNITFYVNSFSSKEGTMKDVFLVDRRDPSNTNTIVAREGRVLLHPKSRTITIHFTGGTIFMVGKKFDAVRTTEFETYDLNIGLDDIMSNLSSRKKAPKEMSIKELANNLKATPKGEMKYNEMIIELMEKFSIPLAVVLMGLIGMPLGAQIKTRSRFHGIVISLVIFFVYYLSLAGVRSIGETGAISPLLGSWLPDLLLLILCCYLINRAAKERSINFLEKLIPNRWKLSRT